MRWTVVSQVRQTGWTAASHVWCDKLATACSVAASVVKYLKYKYFKYFRWKGMSPTNHCWCQKTRVIAFCVVSNYPQCIVWFCHKAHV